MGGRFCSIDRTLVRIRPVARISQRERLFWKFDPILFSLTQIFIGLELDWGVVKIQWFPKKLKKMSLPKLKRFFWPKSQIQVFFSGQKQVISKNYYSHGIWFYIWPDFVRLFPLIYQRSNLDGGTFKSQLGDAQSRWGTLNLDGGKRSPYNSSTVYNIQRG